MSTLIDRLAGVSDGLATKAPVRLATTTDVPLSGLFLIDGVMPAEGDRIVVRAQTDPVLNGIWNASTGPWGRALDFNGARDVVTGTSVFVSDGAVNRGTLFSVSTAGRILPGQTPIAFLAPLVLNASERYAPLYRTGFIGDGVPHPLSERFATLGQAQAVYPRAASLTEQIDQHAVQRLIDLQVLRWGAALIETPPGRWFLHGPLKVDGNAHLRIDGAGIKATSAVQLTPRSKFVEAGLVSRLTGCLELNDFAIISQNGNGAIAIDLRSEAVPSIQGVNIQLDNWDTVLFGFNISASRLEHWRAYRPTGYASEATRTTAAFVFRCDRGNFLNYFVDIQTEGYAYACDYLNETQPGYEGQYWTGLNINAGTSVATIRSTVPGYDAPQWVFTGLEIEVSGAWFDLNNISNVQIEVVLGLTYQASEGFSLFNLIDVIGAEIVVPQIKVFSFPNYIFNLLSNNYGIDMRVGTLRAIGGKVRAGLVYSGPNNSRCIERGLTEVLGWDYSVPFALGGTRRVEGNAFLSDIKYQAFQGGYRAQVDVAGAYASVGIDGTFTGNVNANGDLSIQFPEGLFYAAPMVTVTSGDARTPIEPTAVLYDTVNPRGCVVRCQGAPADSPRRVNIRAVGT